MNSSGTYNKFLWMWRALEAQVRKQWWNSSSFWLLSHIRLIPEINPVSWQVNLLLLSQKSSTALILTVFFLLGLSPFFGGSVFMVSFEKFMFGKNVPLKNHSFYKNVDAGIILNKISLILLTWIIFSTGRYTKSFIWQFCIFNIIYSGLILFGLWKWLKWGG